MGVGWRRFSEKAKQKWHITLDRGFPATANMRNEAMMHEAAEFAVHLRRCEKDIRTLKNATEGLLMTTKIVLSAPLPRVYEETGNGRVAAMPAVAGQPGTLIGGDFKVEDLTRISKETSRKLDTEVLAPMARWNTAFHTVELRMRKLEEIRLEVDSRRRTVQDLAHKVDKQKAKLAQTRAKGEDEMQMTIKTMQHKENKLTAAKQSFKEHEALVYQQLAQLIRDGVWLKSYIAAVMRVEQEAFTTAYNAMGPTKVTQSTTVSVAVADVEVERIGMGASNAMAEAAPQSPASNMYNKAFNTVATRMGNRKPGVAGKENSSFNAPAAPTHRIPAAHGTPVAPAARYDRYSETSAQPVVAW